MAQPRVLSLRHRRRQLANRGLRAGCDRGYRQVNAGLTCPTPQITCAAEGWRLLKRGPRYLPASVREAARRRWPGWRASRPIRVDLVALNDYVQVRERDPSLANEIDEARLELRPRIDDRYRVVLEESRQAPRSAPPVRPCQQFRDFSHIQYPQTLCLLICALELGRDNDLGQVEESPRDRGDRDAVDGRPVRRLERRGRMDCELWARATGRPHHRDVDRATGGPPNSPQRGSVAVAEHGIRATREHRRQPGALLAHLPDRIHASMNRA